MIWTAAEKRVLDEAVKLLDPIDVRNLLQGSGVLVTVLSGDDSVDDTVEFTFDIDKFRTLLKALLIHV